MLVIPVRLGLDPYGLLGKIQGSPGRLDAPDSLASGVVDLLLKNQTTARTMREALVTGLERSLSFAVSKAITGKLEGLDYLTTEQTDRMEAACKNNMQVAQSFGVIDRVQKIIQRFKPSVTDEIPF